MDPNFIIEYWPVWIVGLLLFPFFAVLPQLKKIRMAVEIGENKPKEVGKLFLTPKSLLPTIIFGIATFVCLVLFTASVIIGMIASIRNLFV